ncbi:Sec1 family protein [Trichomonas vaginalis G3]|uniref:Sec1 family protein n=1 Tax=Trichomonas vaginalis (strain ATCC PRA-98 / G3) TaxID=412133 RepID=A2F2C8_TRIV3|nr:vesicle docking involved in exocytosis [Trichomonas vaginalis G3]EAY00947.1 Sec1 family protein [Trichomonas vaginalis G3]KAI5552780.1 vesicle docking involved in exocytosis [Trichomonas vaginalis G3]|eukprot:XP_001330032.1 Sec1 family protein [Trichomonas vaginalis G3]
MNAVESLRAYIDSILPNVEGPKILVLDDETTKIIGLIYSKTELLQHDVVLIDTISKVINKNVDEALTTIQCVCILRPTHEVIRDLSNELNTPHYGSYYLFFTNVLNQAFVTQLAFADHSSKVSVVHEIFLDTYALTSRLFSLGIPYCLNSLKNNIEDPKFQTIVDRLFSMLGALKLKCTIRYDGKSSICRRASERLISLMEKRQEYFYSSDSALLLILDRRTDAITPLLHQWGYVELLHDALTIDNNVIMADGKQLVIDERTDKFFAKYMFSSFPDVNNELMNMSKEIKSSPKPSNIKDFDDLKSFIQTYPDAKDRQETYAKHVSLLSAANSSLTSDSVISRTGNIELDMAVDNNSKALQQIFDEMDKGSFNSVNRLCVIYALKFEHLKENINQLRQRLSSYPRGDEILHNMDNITQMAGEKYSNRDLSVVGQIFSKFGGLIGQMTNEDSGLMRYRCPLEQIIKCCRDGSLSTEEFPFCRDSSNRRFAKVIVFFVGGATYTEAKVAYAASGRGFDVIVGGTNVHNFNSFLKECEY